jgi:hypothetical protein
VVLAEGAGRNMYDVLQDRKCIHIQLDKDIHQALRAKLFSKKLSMQEIFDEFARLIAIDSPQTNKILETFTRKKLIAELAIKSPMKKTKLDGFNELDSDRLYNLISKKDLNEND